MACPGGCIDGGGQPFHHGNIDTLRKRMMAIFAQDQGKKLRKSHENPFIKKLYSEYLGEPNGELAHKLLHTKYVKRQMM
jgi:NADH-quinone oxidoreductase subunit G